MAQKPKLDDFYEEAPDMLAPFRRRYGGAKFAKGEADPFDSDGDIKQFNADQKMNKEFVDAGFSPPRQQ